MAKVYIAGKEVGLKDLLLSDDEIQITQKLGEIWGLFLELPQLHPDDEDEFRFAIHAAQNIILARPGCRQVALGVRPI